MRRALELAAAGTGSVSPNPLVGAVVLDRRGRLAGEGHHARAGGPHAEIVALAAAGTRARGGTLIVTLEPCNHHGRTPPCAPAVEAAGVGRVVYGASDPIAGHRGGGRWLSRRGIAVTRGVLRRECEEQNRIFFTWARRGRPHVILKVASTLDGKAATRTGDSKWITGPEARRRGRQLRAELDAICAGIGTVLADDPRLTARARGARDPIRVVLDSRLRTPPEARVLPANSRSRARCIIAATHGASAAAQRRLEGAGAEIWRLGRGDRVDVEALLARLAGADVTSLMVEGGPRTHASFIAAGVVDELHMFLGPRLFGGGEGSWLGGLGVATVEAAPELVIDRVEPIGPDLLVVARARRRPR
jgi:diaminohydroxyphosphoribosylaminopyrimidine deaminase/5-amino-6-(5-phosphoribosylamino)uracil reductase